MWPPAITILLTLCPLLKQTKAFSPPLGISSICRALCTHLWNVCIWDAQIACSRCAQSILFLAKGRNSLCLSLLQLDWKSPFRHFLLCPFICTWKVLYPWCVCIASYHQSWHNFELIFCLCFFSLDGLIFYQNLLSVYWEESLDVPVPLGSE